MGLRSKLKGAIRRAVLGEGGAGVSRSRPGSSPATQPPPPPEGESPGNLGQGEEVPWYLQDGDADGWDSTNAQDGLDED